MPYKAPRRQVGLKFTDAEFRALEAEAMRAGVPVNTYARHLVTKRAEQPLSTSAASVRDHYVLREAVHQELLDEYASAAYQARALSQQIQQLREHLQLAQWSLQQNRPHLLEEELQQALSLPVLHVSLPEIKNPHLDTDSLINAPLSLPDRQQ